ncbi:ABC transporter substrate-binding protein [Candidatus Woesearchaeota archaeon]|nr:ABC transporter substrate-binding protein [Candidatus Woesearchaeota archaeon]
MNKKTYLAIAIAIIMITILSSCSQTPTGQVTKQKEIKIAAIMTLSGDYAQYGIDEMNAIRLFIDEYNKAHTKQLKLLVEDSQTNPKVAISAFNKLMLSKPDVILAVGSSISLAMQPLVNEQKVPVITVAANPAVADGYMIQNLMTSEDHVNAIIKEINKRDISKIGVIYRNDDFGVSVKDEFKKNFKGEVYVQAADPQERDFRTIITKLKSRNPDALFVIEAGRTLGTLIVQIRELLGDITIYATSEVTYEDVRETAGSSLYNIIYSDMDLDYEKPILKNFKEAYIAKYGVEPSLDSLFAYNAMLLIAECIDNDQALSECLRTSKFKGLTGDLKVENNRIIYSDSMTTRNI